MGLSAGELAQLRADQTEFFPDTCTIQRATSGPNSVGEGTLAWTALATAVPCRLRPTRLQPSIDNIGAQPQTVGQWVVTLSYDQDVQEGDRIIIRDDTYEVVYAWGDEDWKTALRVECQRVE